MTEKALRYNAGKIKYTLAPAVWFREIAKICTKGAIKYTVTKDGVVIPGDDNWMKSINTPDSAQFRKDRMDSIYRHLDDYREGRIYDPEVVPGAEHIKTFTIAHVAWNCLALMFYDIVEGVKDKFASGGMVGLHPENIKVGEKSGCTMGIPDLSNARIIGEKFTPKNLEETTPEEAKRIAEIQLKAERELNEPPSLDPTMQLKKHQLRASHAGFLKYTIPPVVDSHIYEKGQVVATVDATFGKSEIKAPADCRISRVHKNDGDHVVNADVIAEVLELVPANA